MKRWLMSAFVVAAIGACGEPVKPALPAPPALATITLSASDVLLDALGATQTLSAAATDQYGQPFSGATFAWTSSDTSVVTITNGRLTALAPGTAEIRASVGAVISNAAAVTVVQLPGAILVLGGDGQEAPVTEPLPLPIVVEMRDRLGHLIPRRRIEFYVASGDGSVTPNVVEADSMGRASAQWTMGRTARSNALRVSDLFTLTGNVQVRATSTPGPVVGLARLSEPVQHWMIGQPLLVRAKAHDQFGNGVSGVPVEFAVTEGNGSVNPPSVTTTDGVAETSWTIGQALGPQGIEARSPGLAGSPVVFGVLAHNLQITSVIPDTLVEGQEAVVHGTGFDPVAMNNVVTLSGEPATVTAGTTTSLTITVPFADCDPGREVAVRVTTAGIPSNEIGKRLQPQPDYVNLQPGEHLIVQNPSDFCFQFASTGDGLDAYLVGVSTTAERPTTFLSYSLRGKGGFGTAAAGSQVRAPPSRTGAPVAAPTALQASHANAEALLRDWERRNLRAERTPRLRATRETSVPNVGDVLSFRIPTNFSDPCNGFTTIGTRVRAVGRAGIWVTDTLNPVANALTLAEIRAYSDTFDTRIYAVDTTYFGTPSDIDANQRVIIVLSWQVNRIPLGVAGFVFGGDLLPSGCPQSNGGEIFYGHVPDSLNASGNGARRKSSILQQMPSLIAHEFTHNIQQSRRLVLSPGTVMSSWEAEGQATFAEEVVAHSIFGHSPGQNYGPSVARLPAPSGRWYEPNFSQVGQYFGWVGGANRTDQAPELCTLFGTTSIATSCSPFAFYGASWSFQRYLSDRFGPSYPGGERGLHRDLISKNVQLRGSANIAALDLGVPFDRLFSEWAAMLYVDDRFAGMGQPLSLTSWNLGSIFSSLPPALQLVVPERTIGPFGVDAQVRGGSTAYLRLNGVSARSGFALSLRDAPGTPLDLGMQPRFWIVRLQ